MIWEISMWQTKQNKLSCFIDRLCGGVGGGGAGGGQEPWKLHAIQNVNAIALHVQ